MFRHGASAWVPIALGVLLGGFFATPASAQVTPGIRAGLSLDPDQFFIGGHVETMPLVDRLHFRPNVEAGFGDDVTLVGVNFEFIYRFPLRQRWQVYVGGGPALNVRSNGRSDTEGGFNILLGAEQREGLLFEIKIGAADSPGIRFTVGYAFH